MTGLAASASGDAVALSWNPATDNVAVAGCDVLRDGDPIGSSPVPGFVDASVAPDTTYSYAVRAFDAAPNTGPETDPLVVTTPSSPPPPPPPPPVTTHFPVADAHVRSKSANKNYGSLDHLRLRSGSTSYQGYLKFDVTGTGGNVASAVLRLYVDDASVDGGTLYEAATTTWTESGITWSSAPGPIGPVLASVGSVAVGQWVQFDVTTLVNADGFYAFVLTSDSTNSVYYSSRETANPPELVITTN